LSSKTNILLIDPDPSAQASASLAFDEEQFSLQTLSIIPSNLVEKLSKAPPDIIICSSDICGVTTSEIDTFKLFRQIKDTKATANIGLLVLAERDDQVLMEAELAQGKNFDHVLAKPFNKGQIVRAVKETLSTESDTESSGGATGSGVLLLIKDALLQQVLKRFLDQRGLDWQLCSDQEEAVEASSKKSFAAICLEWETVENLDWFKPTEMGEMVIILEDETFLKSLQEAGTVNLITRPLSLEKLRKMFTKLFPDSEVETIDSQIELETNSQAMLAARISAAIFEKLVNQPALRNGQWHTAGKAAEEELIRICTDFSKRLKVGQGSKSN